MENRIKTLLPKAVSYKDFLKLMNKKQITTELFFKCTNINVNLIPSEEFEKYSIAFVALLNEIIQAKELTHNNQQLMQLANGVNENGELMLNDTNLIMETNKRTLEHFFVNNRIADIKMHDISEATGLSEAEIAMCFNNYPEIKKMYKAYLEAKTYKVLENLYDSAEQETYDESAYHKYRATTLLLNNVSTPITIKKEENIKAERTNFNFNIFKNNNNEAQDVIDVTPTINQQ